MTDSPKTRRKAQCLLCGMRIGGAKSAFCNVDAKIHSVKFVIKRRTVHRWVWVREVSLPEGKSIGNFEAI